MSTVSPLLADALGLVDEDLLIHLDGADSLATQSDEWSEQDKDDARGVLGDLVLMIRGLLIEHERTSSSECRTCGCAWPCPVVTTIHGFLKDPHRQFVALVNRARGDG
ncbi:MAG: hypothetical protein ACRDS0_09755 [Pseudonocardiaceae bacterium]